MPSTVDTTERPVPRDRPRQVLTWAVIVLLLASLIVIVVEAIRSEPASAPTGSPTPAPTAQALDSSSDHLYSYADEA